MKLSGRALASILKILNSISSTTKKEEIQNAKLSMAKDYLYFWGGHEWADMK
jgi:hypothetical protein